MIIYFTIDTEGNGFCEDCGIPEQREADGVKETSAKCFTCGQTADDITELKNWTF